EIQGLGIVAKINSDFLEHDVGIVLDELELLIRERLVERNIAPDEALLLDDARSPRRPSGFGAATRAASGGSGLGGCIRHDRELAKTVLEEVIPAPLTCAGVFPPLLRPETTLHGPS